MKTQTMTKADAAEMLMYILKRAKMAELATENVLANDILVLAKERGIEVPVRCPGEAHGNYEQDSCSVCAPGWGFVMDPIKIK